MSSTTSTTATLPAVIPYDLLPVTENQYTIEWAKKTFKYAHLFDNHQFQSRAYINKKELDEWMIAAKKLRKGINDMGLNATTNKLIQLATTEYNMKMPITTNQNPVNFEDLICIISNNDWYKKNVDIARRQLWMMQYGIFRNDYDDWLKEFERNWLQEHNMQYDLFYKERLSTNKGFVYCNIVRYVGNLLCERIKRVCIQNHREFITSRKKKARNEDKYTYTETRLHRFRAYIVQVDINDDPYKEYLAIQEQHIRKVRRTINTAMENGVTKEQINKLVKICVEKKSSGKTYDPLKVCYYLYILTKYITAMLFFFRKINTYRRQRYIHDNKTYNSQ